MLFFFFCEGSHDDVQLQQLIDQKKIKHLWYVCVCDLTSWCHVTKVVNSALQALSQNIKHFPL